MGHYTRFHFRAKLAFHTPPAVYEALDAQFNRPYAGPSGGYNIGEEDTTQWAWNQTPASEHPFFGLPRAALIPHFDNGRDYPKPVFVRRADGGALVEFTCEFKAYNDEIQQFIAWLTPYIRARFGKRLRGRDKVWVGWVAYESGGYKRLDLFTSYHPYGLPS